MTLDERLWKSFNKALGQYQLIDEDDHILVGLSGGKDSLLLTEFLARRQHILKPHFTVSALHVRMEFISPHSDHEAEHVSYESDTSYLQSFCECLGVPLHIITTSFEKDPVPHGSATVSDYSSSGSGSKKPACFLCSWQRRKQLFNLAQKLGCTKIALGHHQDDIIHTALMNLIFQGHFSTMPAKLRMQKMPLTIIRPLCLCHEADIQAYAKAHNYEKQLKQCPYEHETKRTTAADLFAYMKQINPEIRYSIWHALEADEKLTEY